MLIATSNNIRYCTTKRDRKHELALWAIFDMDDVNDEHLKQVLNALPLTDRIDGTTVEDIQLQLETQVGIDRVYFVPENCHWHVGGYKGYLAVTPASLYVMPYVQGQYSEADIQALLEVLTNTPNGLAIRFQNSERRTYYSVSCTKTLKEQLEPYKIRLRNGVFKYNPNARAATEFKRAELEDPLSIDWFTVNDVMRSRLEVNVLATIPSKCVRPTVTAMFENVGFSNYSAHGWFEDLNLLLKNLEILKQSGLMVSKKKAKSDLEAVAKQFAPHIKGFVRVAWKTWSTGGTQRHSSHKRDKNRKLDLMKVPQLLKYMPSLKKDFDAAWATYQKKYDDKPIKIKKAIA